MGKVLAPLFQSRKDILDLPYSLEDLIDLPDVGPETAESILIYFSENKAFLARLLEVVEVQFQAPVSQKNNLPLSGKKICITGSFEKYSRDDLIKILEENGGEFISSVSKHTDYLLAGEKA